MYLKPLNMKPRIDALIDNMFNAITSTGHRAHRELATHKQGATLPRSRRDKQMEMSAHLVREPLALFGECVVRMGLGYVHEW
jgi:hypothetical protein